MELKEKEYKIIKAIITRKKYLLFFDTIDKIYFDTYGKYPFLKESDNKSDYIINFISTEDKYCMTLRINDKINTSIKTDNIYNTFIDGNNIGFREKNNKIYNIRKIRNAYKVKFLLSKFSYNDIFYITDKIIRYIDNRVLLTNIIETF